MDIERITAREFLRHEASARRNGPDQFAFKHLKGALKKLPQVEERLAFEFLDMVSRALEQRTDPGTPAFWAFFFHDSITAPERGQSHTTTYFRSNVRLCGTDPFIVYV